MRAIFERDFMRFAKTKKFFVLRTCIVGIPAGLLMLIAALMTDMPADTVGRWIFGSTVFTILILAILVTPAMLCQVLVEERHTNNWEVLRSAPLTITSIVCGKWLSRLALLTVICLAALPLSAMSLLFGGVSILQFLEAALIIFLSLLWVSAFSICVSAVARDLVVASRTAYVVIVLYVVGGMMVMTFGGMFWTGGGGPSVFANVIGVILSMNPIIVMLFSVFSPMGMGSGPLWMSPILLYTLFSTVATAGFILLSIHMLKREQQGSKAAGAAITKAGAAVPTMALPWSPEPSAGVNTVAETGEVSTRLLRIPGRFSRSKRVLSRNPALWLELRRGATKPRSIWKLFGLIGVGLAEVFFLLQLYEMHQRGTSDIEMVHFLPIFFTLGAAFFAVASAGAAAFHRDHEVKTLEVLHSTPLSSRSLATGKASSVLLSALPWWGLSLAHGFLAVMLGDHSFFAWLAYAMVSAGLLASLAAFSMQVSLSATSSARALLRTMLIVVGHLIIYPILFLMTMAIGASGSGEFVSNMFMGHHPFYIALVPHLLAEEQITSQDGWAFPIFYWLGYLVHASIALKSSIPKRYAAKREENWSPSPPRGNRQGGTSSAMGAAQRRGEDPATARLGAKHGGSTLGTSAPRDGEDSAAVASRNAQDKES